MKRNIYIFFFLLLLTSCDSFLEYKDKDKLIPTQLEHYNELIYGELLIKNAEGFGRALEIMTDDVGNKIPVLASWSQDKREPKFYGWYTWGKEPQIDPKGEENIDNSWSYFYHAILMCNIIESEVGALPEDSEGVKWRLLGEVQCVRAMSYYYLVGMYGAPYRDSTVAKTAMGVPVNTATGVYDRLYERSTLQEIYDLMKKDLNAALENFNKGEVKNTIFRPNPTIAKLFLSRIYLTEKQYDRAITICKEALAETGSSIMQKEDLMKCGENKIPFFEKNNSSIFFTWMERWGWGANYLIESPSDARYLVSDDLKNLYGENLNDIRFSKFFGQYFTPVKESSKTNTYQMCYRVEEFYFNLAEAYIAKGTYDLGLEEINKVRKERISDDNYKLVASSQEEANREFRKEKRREFCFEDIRWYDMKRWGETVTHRYNDYNNSDLYETFILEADSPNYILPLPLDIQRRNDKIERPARVDAKRVN